MLLRETQRIERSVKHALINLSQTADGATTIIGRDAAYRSILMANVVEVKMEKAKQAFLDAYNPKRDLSIALSKAWGAAVQRNLLYSKDVGFLHPKRKEVRGFWAERVNDISKQSMTSLQYENSFLALKDDMNGRFKGSFGAEGFRISHAQKGLSVYMKHLWCMDLIDEPPQCPVDWRILVEIRKTVKDEDLKNIAWTKKELNDIAWTTIDSIDVHRKIMNAIRAVKGAKSFALWELEAFPASQKILKQ